MAKKKSMPPYMMNEDDIPMSPAKGKKAKKKKAKGKKKAAY